MKGLSSTLDGMGCLDINATSVPNQHSSYQENSVHEIKNKECITQFFLNAMSNPVSSTWIKAIDAGFVDTWSLLNSNSVKNTYLKKIEASKGCVRVTRSNARLTKPLSTTSQIPNKFLNFSGKFDIPNKLLNAGGKYEILTALPRSDG